MLKTHFTQNQRRPGVVLLVVMAMLALFATVALSFVFYAEHEATIMRYASQAETLAQADADPEMLLSYFLSQLIFDTDNIYSAMRGHSLARNMYGYNPTDMNVIPYNGLGRLRFDVPHTALDGTAAKPASRNNMLLINYQNYSGVPGVARRDPETDAQGNYVGGNVHWTYPDLNNMFLAAVNGNGTVLMPSFYRPWMGVDQTRTIDPWAKYMTLRPHPSYHPRFTSPDWDEGGDVKNLEWGLGTRLNSGAYANNDSIWMDLGFPVLTAPNGKRFKALFAPMIVDLDNKINLFVHGNIMNAGNKEDPTNSPHFSNRGFGWWEVNLGKVLNRPFGPLTSTSTKPSLGTEWTKLFKDSPIARYGPDGKPDAPGANPMNNSNTAPFSTPVIPPYYSQIDVGGLTGYKNHNGTIRYIYYPGDILDPTYANNKINMLNTFPNFPPHWDNGTTNDMINHASGYDPFALSTTGAKDDRIALAMSQLEVLYRYQGTGSPAMTADFFANLPQNMIDPKIRWLSTLRSMDLDRPGLFPFNPNTGAALLPPTTGPGAVVSAPPLLGYLYNPLNNPLKKYAVATPGTFPTTLNTLGGEFAPVNPATGAPARSSDGRSNVYNKAADGSDQLRVLLNRNLTPYPAADASVRGLPATGLINLALSKNKLQFDRAVKDRQDMAADLYNMLVKVTGARDPRQPQKVVMVATSPEFQAARWLAQLALNIVDFIDEDDYLTPWQWVAGEWLFGTELPRLLVNEVYAQVDNDASEKALWSLVPGAQKATNYRVNFWIELHNPMRPPSGGALFPRDNGKAVLQSQSQNNYRLVVTTADNFNGDAPTNDGLIQGLEAPIPVPGVPPRLPPTTAPKFQVVDNFPPGVREVDVAKADNVNNSYFTLPVWKDGFYVLGPAPPPFIQTSNNDPNRNRAFLDGRDPKIQVSSGVDTTGKQTLAKFANLSWSFPAPDKNAAAANRPENQKYLVCLQRLANPNIPFQKNPALPLYNPYVTVDYFDISTTPTNGSNPPDNALHMNVVYSKEGNKTLNLPAVTKFNSVGRRQPYVNSRRAAQNPNPPKTTEAQTTFFRHNGRELTLAKEASAGAIGKTLDLPFWWPVHMDRQLVNPIELLNVSCYRPWEFTQKFGNDPKLGGDQRAPWDDQATLLYRLLEMTQTPYFVRPNRTGVLGGPVTGKININTIWDQEILDALVDHPSIDINNLFKAFMESRSPGVFAINLPGAAVLSGFNPGPTDEIDFKTDLPSLGRTLNKPFKSLNVGIYNAQTGTQYPNGLGIENTILRNGVFHQGDAPYPGGLAFKKNEILAKIFNNTTLRSNVFAVWLTVGFFEVVDESVYPQKLGSEIGRGENRHVRHRMFAIVDRTKLMTPDPKVPQYGQFQGRTTTAVGKGSTKVGLSQVSWNLSSDPPGLVNVDFRIRPGMTLKMAGDLVKVQDVDYVSKQITATFTKTYPPGTIVVPVLSTLPIVLPGGTGGGGGTVAGVIPTTPGPLSKSMLGNPGPQDSFDPRQNTLLVPHFSIIQ